MVKKTYSVHPKSPQIDESGLSSRELKDILSWRPPKRKPRIYADMDVPKYLIDYARDKLKWDIFCVRENDELMEQHDYYHFERAKQLKRILLSFDDAFLNNRRFKLLETDGIIVFSNPGKSQLDSLIILIRVNELLIDLLRRDSRAMKGIKIKVTTTGFTLKTLSESSQKISKFIRW